jgi:membrane protease YdiL (CAAX protease family)
MTAEPLSTTSASSNQRHPVFPERVPWVAVAVFLVLALGLSWLVALPLWLSGDGLANPFLGLVAIVMMYTPLVAALVVVFFVQKPRPQRIAEYLGLWPLTPAKRVVWMTVLGLFGAVLLVILTTLVAGAVGLVELDLVGFSGFAAILAEASPTEIPIPVGVLVLIQLLTIPIGALINSFASIGEELGWRGWLLPSLMPLGTWPALLLTGVVWGLWHSPLILLGYNFARPSLEGVALMTMGCIMLGVLLGWLRLRSGSVWPAVVAHGAFNAAAGLLSLVIAAGVVADSAVVGPLGWVAWIVMAAVIVVLVTTGQFRTQPRLGRAATASSTSVTTTTNDSTAAPGPTTPPTSPPTAPPTV